MIEPRYDFMARFWLLSIKKCLRLSHLLVVLNELDEGAEDVLSGPGTDAFEAGGCLDGRGFDGSEGAEGFRAEHAYGTALAGRGAHLFDGGTGWFAGGNSALGWDAVMPEKDLQGILQVFDINMATRYYTSSLTWL